jgi:hypothetical protein
MIASVRVMLAACALFAVASAGCASSGGGWSANGFEQEKFGWKADYPAGQTALMGPDWRLDNWEKDVNGRLAEKTGDGYVAVEDLNHDGEISFDEQRVVVFDLKFNNVHNNGVVWVQTRTLEEQAAAKDLDVLLENYVKHSVGHVATNVRAVFSTRTDVKLGKYSAVSALVELRPSRESPPEEGTKELFRKLHVVLTRFDYLGPAPASTQGATGPGSIEQPTARSRYTAMLVIAYANDSDRFDASLPDFAKLLAQVQLPDPPPESPKKGAKKAAAGNPTSPAPPPAKAPAVETPPPPTSPKPKAEPDRPTLEI